MVRVRMWGRDDGALEEDGASLGPVASYLQYGCAGTLNFLPDLVKGSLSRRPPRGGLPLLGIPAPHCYWLSPFCPLASKSTTRVPVPTPAGLPTMGPGLHAVSTCDSERMNVFGRLAP
jgi:hypothetical protein